MRYAIISDIHSNLPALTKALQAIKKKNIDKILCLGDIVGYGAQPNECVELVREYAAVSVMGNHDAVATGNLPLRHLNRAGEAAMTWTLSILENDNADFLAALPLTIDVETFTLVHASPFRPDRWIYVASPVEAQDAFGAMHTELAFLGHTHVPGLLSQTPSMYRLTKGHRFVINVGSIGQPRDGNNQLSFGILDSDKWEYENVRLDYDIRQAADAIIESGLPPVLARRLFEGS